MPRKWTGCLISTTNHSWIRLKLRPEPLAENSTLNCDPRRDDRDATRQSAAPPKRLLKPAAGRVVKRHLELTHLELTPYRTESGEAGVAVPAGKAACVGVIVTAAPLRAADCGPGRRRSRRGRDRERSPADRRGRPRRRARVFLRSDRANSAAGAHGDAGAAGLDQAGEGGPHRPARARRHGALRAAPGTVPDLEHPDPAAARRGEPAGLSRRHRAHADDAAGEHDRSARGPRPYGDEDGAEAVRAGDS